MPSDQKNALFAVVLSGLILFGWQYFFAPKAPAPVADLPPSDTKIVNENTPAQANDSQPVMVGSKIELREKNVSVDVSSNLIFSAFSHNQARFPFAEVVGSESPLQIEIAPEGQKFVALNLVTTQSTETSWEGEDLAAGVKASLSFTGEEMVGLKVTSAKPFKYRLTFKSEDKKLENGQVRYFSYYDDSLNHWKVGSDELDDTTVSWAGIDFNYHLFAVSFDKAPGLVLRSLADGRFQMFPNYTVPELSFNVLYVKKEYNYLSSLGRNLKHAVDFGIWGFFAEIILKGLQFFYSLVPNYGIAIIFLTFVVRFITFPLQYKSFVSMKRMQLVQPEMTKIKEKFKDDPMRMQKETMELFKRSGANPLGGCLPMILQLPVFFAFYKVLYSAVELVDAPFILWLHDLSNKDPYFVLPVLMAGAMFLQQKLTPSTVTDPVQKKIFMFMPLIFGFIMKDLPSGLSLYIFVSTLLGIGQQLLVFKISGNKPVVV
ncbi:MAG: membrane protein insertase YidC [Bacteriovoracaceae bacterium]|nr:membrane protein insertase YidC [Bacteriovoracaceae bacterium]